jgi:hypothetical protein
MPASKAIQQLEERMSNLEPTSLRYQALEAAKQFKSSWIHLGRMLWTVFKEKKFREWGYLSFDAYCAKEVAIRANTAKKLLHSYYFLEKEEPSVLQQLDQEPPAKVPSVDSVNLLRLLKNKEEVPQEDYQQVRTYVLEKGKEAPEVRKQVRSIMESVRPETEEDQADRKRSSVKRMIGLLKGVKAELVSGHLVPKKLLQELDGVVRKLEQAL